MAEQELLPLDEQLVNGIKNLGYLPAVGALNKLVTVADESSMPASKKELRKKRRLKKKVFKKTKKVKAVEKAKQLKELEKEAAGRVVRKLLPIPLNAAEGAAATAAIPVPMFGAVPAAIYGTRIMKGLRGGKNALKKKKYVGVDKKTGKKVTMSHGDIEEDVALATGVAKLKKGFKSLLRKKKKE